MNIEFLPFQLDTFQKSPSDNQKLHNWFLVVVRSRGHFFSDTLSGGSSLNIRIVGAGAGWLWWLSSHLTLFSHIHNHCHFTLTNLTLSLSSDQTLGQAWGWAGAA